MVSASRTERRLFVQQTLQVQPTANAMRRAAIGGRVAPVIIGIAAGAALGDAAKAGGRSAADYFFE